MFSWTALTILCLALSSGLAQHDLIFARPSSSQTRSKPVANEKELIFSSTSNEPTSLSSSYDRPTKFNSEQTRPSSFGNRDSILSSLPIFSSSREASPSYVEPRQGISNEGSSSFDNSRQTNQFNSPQSSSSSLGSKVQGTPVFQSSTLPGSAPVYKPAASIQDVSFQQLSKGAEKFALEFLTQISNVHLAVPRRSYMVSPLSVWSLLMLLNEGAQDRTLYELQQTLNVGNNEASASRTAYREITRRLNARTAAVELASYQALFTDINKPVKRDYENIIEREYEAVLTPVDFGDVNNTFVKINNDISRATRGLLPHSVLPQDLIGIELLMISALYFKGKWRNPFDYGLTHSAPFHDEFGNVTGNVEMMTQFGEFTYTQVKELDCHILELPYGEANRMSMLIMLPKKGVTVNSVIKALPRLGLSGILEQLDEEVRLALSEGTTQEVEVFLPKFETESHFSMRYILENMGLIDIFQPAYANLNNISKDIYVSSIFQSTRIIVNEEGTEAAAVSVGTLLNKASPVRFYMDRPFGYMIVERNAKLILFAGEIKSHN